MPQAGARRAGEHHERRRAVASGRPRRRYPSTALRSLPSTRGDELARSRRSARRSCRAALLRLRCCCLRGRRRRASRRRRSAGADRCRAPSRSGRAPRWCRCRARRRRSASRHRRHRRRPRRGDPRCCRFAADRPSAFDSSVARPGNCRRAQSVKSNHGTRRAPIPHSQCRVRIIDMVTQRSNAKDPIFVS